MKIISEDEVNNALTMDEIIEDVRQAYKDNEAGKIVMPERVYMPVRGDQNVGQWLMAVSYNQPYFGTKFSSVFPNNREHNLPVTISQVSLYSAETGQIQALIDANYLTAYKTGASAAVATDLMARKDASSMGVIGSGFQGLSQVKAIQHVRHLKKVYIFDSDASRLEPFAERLKKIAAYDFEIIIAKSAKEVVENSDIISTCTPSHTPVFNGHDLKPGTHINAIGSFTKEMQEIDDTTVVKADHVVTEHVDGLWKAAGDIITPLNKGLITKDKVNGSLGDVLTGKCDARQNDQEITLYESVGSGVLDMALAIAIYEKLK